MAMRFLRRLTNVMLLVVLGGVVLMSNASLVVAAQGAQPPMLLDGFVYIDGVRAEAGIPIEARIDGETVASGETASFRGQSGYYVLLFEAGEEGDQVSLFVDGDEANESPVEYESGAQTLNLTVGTEELATYELTISVAGDGETDPEVGEGTYPEGSLVTIRAFAAEGWSFDRWAGDVSDQASPVTTVIMDGDKSVTATFVQPTATASPTLTATPEPTAEATGTLAETATPEPTSVASPERPATYTPSATAAVEETASPSPSATATVAATEPQEESPTPTGGAASAPTATATSAGPSPTAVTASATARPTATASEVGEATASPSAGSEGESDGLPPLIIAAIVLGVLGAAAVGYGIYALKPWRIES
jgi:hypothetical protein